MRLLIYDEGMYVYTCGDDSFLLLYNCVRFRVELGSAEKHELSGQRSHRGRKGDEGDRRGGGEEGRRVFCVRGWR
jgi:hypothetical protein